MQRSEELVSAGRKVRLYKNILSCHRNKLSSYTPKTVKLAQKLEIELPDLSKLTRKVARELMRKAISDQRAVFKEAGEHRAKWLERMAQEVALMKDPDADWEKVLRGMIAAARSKVMNTRLSAIFRPEWANLDFIKIPVKKWFLSQDETELYDMNSTMVYIYSTSTNRGYCL